MESWLKLFRDVRDTGFWTSTESFEARKNAEPYVYMALYHCAVLEQWRIGHIRAALLSAVLAGCYERLEIPFRTLSATSRGEVLLILKELEEDFGAEVFRPTFFNIVESVHPPRVAMSLFAPEELEEPRRLTYMKTG